MGLTNETMPVCIFRTGTIHGPGREWKNQLKMMAGQPIPFDGSSDVMIVHRDDVVQAIKLAIDKGFSGLFNLFNEVTCSKAEFFAKVCDENGYDHVQWLNLSPGPKNVSNEKIKSHGLDFLDPDATRDAENLLD